MSNITVTSGQSTNEFSKAQEVETPKEETKQTSASVEETQQDETTEQSESLEQSADESQDLESQETDKDQENKGVRKRIDKLTKRLSLKDQEIEHWKAQALKGQKPVNDEQHQEPQKQQTQSADANEPQEEQFDTYRDYLKAVVKWEFQSEEKAKLEKAEKAKSQEIEGKRAQEFQTKLQEFEKAHPDFQEVIQSVELPVLMHVQEVIRNSDLPAQVMYELAKNPGELERLNSLSIVQAAKEIGKLEARLSVSSESTNQEKPQQSKQTKAPAPLSTIGKGSAPVKKSIYDQDLPFAEYEKMRREQIKAKLG